MDEDHVVPQLKQNNNKINNKKNNNLVVPNKDEISIEDEGQDEEAEPIDMVLVLEIIIKPNLQVQTSLIYKDINQLIEEYPFEDQPIRTNPRNLNLSINELQEIQSHINIITILERMDLLETNIYYVIFEQRI